MSTVPVKLPWMKFYPNDWRGEACLRICSLGARGLWMEMLAVMHEAAPRGSLMMNGKPMTLRQLAALVGASVTEVEGLLGELRDAGVFSEDDNGTIFSRRMRRDDKKSAEDKENGQLGGHPDIRRGTLAKDERVRRFRRSDAPAKARRIFDRSDGCCHWCQKKLDRENYHIDHVKAVRDGGTNDESNLVAACPNCNGERAMTWGRSDSDLKVGQNSDLKAQRLEARSQKLENPPPSLSVIPASDVQGDFEGGGDFQKIWEKFPKAKTESPNQAQAAFDELSVEERGKFSGCIDEIAAEIRKQKLTHPYNLAGFIRDRRFVGFQASLAAISPKVRVEQDSPQGRAHEAFWRREKRKGVPWSSGVWWFDTEWPPDQKPPFASKTEPIRENA